MMRATRSLMPSPVLERFLRYVTYDTQSREDCEHLSQHARATRRCCATWSPSCGPSGIPTPTIDQHGYVMATIPATTRKADVPVIGFIAHVDTSPEMSGAGVKPIVHRAYDGRDLVLPDDPSAVLRVADMPYLGECLGHDIVTASGTTLLGADNKSGVAEIMTAAERLMAIPEIPHGPIRIAFTPDEEVGHGTKYFDVARFGARYAYTMDGGARGELEYESFSADAITITFRGFNTHPGYAKGRMVNAIKLAARFIERLPADRCRRKPPMAATASSIPTWSTPSVDRTSVKLLLRDFNTPAAAREGGVAAAARGGGRGDVPGAAVRGDGRRVVSQHARGARRASAGRRACAGGDTRAGLDGPRASDSRRHRRLAAVVHGPADAEHLCRRAELPFAPRMGLGAGHGEGRRRDRRTGEGVGGADHP